MTEHDVGTDTGRLAAHERLSSGALASWMRACANHPWRVMITWVGIIAGLILLVATVGGSLKDEFSIPGSETQKATDLIEAEFAAEQGGVLNIVFAAPEGERLDEPAARKAAILAAIAKLRTPEFATIGPDERAGVESVGDPFSENTFSEDGRIAYAEAQFDRVIYDKDREEVLAVQEAVREAVAAEGVVVEFNGDAEFPPIEQGTQELLGLLAALIVLLVVFRTLVATAIPLALAIVALMTAFLLLFILAGLTDINTITPLLVSMIGLGVGIDYSLFIVTRFRQLLHDGLSPRDAAAEAGASAGRATVFAGLTVAISVTGLAFFGMDFITKLGIGSALGVLTTVLIANSLLIAVLAKLGHKVDRLKVPFLRRIDDSEEARERTLIARWGRFVTAHARAVFVVVLLVLLVAAATSGLVRLGASDQGTQPSEQTARRAYDLLAEGFGAGFNGPIPIVIDVNGDAEAPQRVYDGVQRLEGVASVGEPQFNDAKTVAIVFVTPDSAPQDEETGVLVDRLQRRRRTGRDRGRRRGRLRLRPERGVQGHRGPDLRATPAVPALHHRRHVPRARDGVPVGRDRARRSGDDAHLGLRRIRRAHADHPGRAPAVPDRARPNGTDRDVRAADRLRDPLRALDGLHGVPHEPHPRGARPRPEHEGGRRARHRRDRARRRRGRVDHGHRLRGVHPHGGPHLEGVRPAARGRDPDRRAARADDARAVVPHDARREVVVHAALARQAPAEHHDRAAARRRGTAPVAVAQPEPSEA